MVSFLESLGAIIFYSEPIMLILMTAIIFWFNILQQFTRFHVPKLLLASAGNLPCYFMVATAFNQKCILRVNSEYFYKIVLCLFPQLRIKQYRRVRSVVL